MLGRNGWYKRRQPIIQPPPTGAGSQGVGLGGGAATSTPLVVRSEDNTARAVVVVSPVPRQTASLPSAVAWPPKVVRWEAHRGGLIVIGQRPGQRATPPRPIPPLVVRWDRRRPGKAFRTPLIAAKINVAGGVIVPWVFRRDYQRDGVVYRVLPFLKEPPPPIAGAVRQPLVIRWGHERSALVYLERPLLVPPPLILDGRTWISFYSEARQLEWFGWNRKLTWEPGMATFLTKRTGEARQYAMDFSALPELTNGNLSGVTSVVSNVQTIGASNVTLTSPALGSNGKTATVWISGGQSGAVYQIAFTVTVAGGTVLEEFGYLLVEDE